MTGKIVKGIGGFYYVYVPNHGLYECKAKGVFRNRNEKPLVGDMVLVEELDGAKMTGNIIRILPRKNALVRPEVANVDQVMVIFAVTDPAPNLHLLDYYLVRMEDVDVPVVICFNKVDLVKGNGGEADSGKADADDVDSGRADSGKADKLPDYRAIYEQAGYDVFMISTRTGEGMDELNAHLAGKTTVLAGPSGVGKSSLMNAIHPEADMETGEISKKLGRGRHTTRHSEIFCINDDTYVMDTPGFSSLRLPMMEPEKLRAYFPEYAPYEGQCRFNGCLHINEPDCLVKAAIKEGKLSKERYESYLLMYEEVKAQKKW